MKILTAAYACEPGRGSEPGAGWMWIREIARRHEVWAITRANNRVAIEQALASEPLENVHWVWFDLPPSACFWKYGAGGVRAYAYLWQWAIGGVARRLDLREHFDLVHHLTLSSAWTPSGLARLAKPFVWGPLGGLEQTDPRLRSALRLAERAGDAARWAAVALGGFDPLAALTARRADRILIQSPAAACRLGRAARERGVGMDSIGVELRHGRPVSSGPDFELISVGELRPHKGHWLGIEAFARMLDAVPRARYTIVGEGPERARLEAQVARLELTNKVRLLGRLPREAAMEMTAAADLMLHPCLRDPPVYAVAEAMAAARPLAALDAGAMREQIGEEAGKLVEPTDEAETARRLADALVELARDPARRERMGAAGQRRAAAHFDWRKKGERLEEIYRDAIAAYSAGRERATCAFGSA